MVDTPTQRSTATGINESYKIACKDNREAGYCRLVMYLYQYNLGQVPSINEIKN
ncbi:MAG: hypothetical protein N2558_03890 [Patescibacteria group bacterium]|nr:hypothetical protein [Patescibacteria group bacterium]